MRDTAEVSNVPTFQRIMGKMTVSGSFLVVGEYVDVKVFVRAGSSLISFADDQRGYAKLYAKVNDPSSNIGDGNSSGLDDTTAIFQLQFESIIISQVNIGDLPPSTLGDELSFALGGWRRWTIA